MLEAKIHKEITEYEGKIFFGMTGKQIICVLIAAAIDIPMFFLLYKNLGVEVTGYLCIFIPLPILAIGFFKYRGMSIITLLKLAINFYFKGGKLSCVNNIATDYLEGVNDNADRRVRKNRKTHKGTECECFGYTAGNRRQLRRKHKEVRKYLATYKKEYVLQQKKGGKTNRPSE